MRKQNDNKTMTNDIFRSPWLWNHYCYQPPSLPRCIDHYEQSLLRPDTPPHHQTKTRGQVCNLTASLLVVIFVWTIPSYTFLNLPIPCYTLAFIGNSNWLSNIIRVLNPSRQQADRKNLKIFKKILVRVTDWLGMSDRFCTI